MLTCIARKLFAAALAGSVMLSAAVHAEENNAEENNIVVEIGTAASDIAVTDTAATSSTTAPSSVAAVAAPSVTVGPCTSVAVQSEIYEISTRHLPDLFCSIDEANPRFAVKRWGDCRWETSDISTALGKKNGVIEDKLTILYVHGNFMEQCNTLERVRLIDAYLKRRAKEDYRLLLFSWPSQRERHALRDVYENAESAEDQSLYLAWILRELRPQSRVSLQGFSFGARAVAGALHLDAGGQLPGLVWNSSGTPPREIPYRLGLIAPAIDKNVLLARGRDAQALDQVSHFVHMYNSSDPILRRFRFLDRITRPIAAGFAGFEGLNENRSALELGSGSADRHPPLLTKQFDCSPYIGNTHAEKSYLGECPYFSIMVDTLLWNTEGIGATVCSKPVR